MSERTFRETVQTLRGHKYIRLKSGRLVGFWDVLGAAESAHTSLCRAASRAFKLAAAADADREVDDVLRGYDMEHLERFLDDVEDYVRAMRAAVEKQRGARSMEDRIALLRNTQGRTEVEAAAFRRKADQLEEAMRHG